MTNELEKQFFDTFGIEPKEFKSCDVGTFCPYPEKECGTDTCPYYKTYKVDYPAISDSILLELICIVAKYYCFRWDNWIDEYSSVDKLKNFILLELIGLVHQQGIKHQVRTLFEEG